MFLYSIFLPFKDRHVEKTTPKITKKTLSPSPLTILKKRVSELERANKTLQIENSFLRELYDKAPLGYQSLDENGCFMEVNKAWLDILGYSRQEVIGRNFGDFLHQDWRDHFRENFPRFKAIGEILGVEFEMVKKDGTNIIVSFNGKISNNSDGKFKQTHCIFRDITFYNQVKEQREAERRLLQICHVNTDFRKLMRELTRFFHELTGCEAIGIRMRRGEDFPYYETKGFPGDFIILENSLCAFDINGNPISDSAGNPVLECMCGNILMGRFDPAKPFFTKNGSFWTNSTSELLASTTEEDRKARTRNRCNGEGYESVALIPLRTSGKTYGLIQFNDPRKNRFTPEKIGMLEHLADHVALSISKHLTEEELRNSKEHYRTLFDNSPVSIWEEDFSEVKSRMDELRNSGITDFRTYFRQNPDEIARMAGLVRVLDINQQSVRLLGATDKKEVIRRLPDYFTAKSLEVFAEELIALAEGKTRFESEIEIIDIKGDPLTLYLFLFVDPLDAENLSRVLISFLDITEQKAKDHSIRESEEKFRTLASLAPVGIYLTDPKGLCQYVNSRWCEMAGLTQEEAMGKGWIQGLYPEDRDTVFASWERMVESEGRWGLEYRFVNREGKVTTVYGLATPQRDDTGKILRYIGVNLDLTEFKRIEDNLRQSEINLKSFVNAIPESAFMIDPDGTILTLNKTTAERLGQTSDEMLGANIYDFIPEEIGKSRKLMVEKVLLTKKSVSFEDERHGRSIYNSINPVPDGKGNVARLAIIGVDITDRKKIEDALNASLVEKSQLLREVHHRVKNNLAAIIALLELQKNSLTDQSSQIIFTELRNRIRAMSLIHEKLYRSESLAEIDFEDYARNLISHLRTSFGSRNIECVIAAKGVKMPLNIASPCGMILNEIVTNSLKYAFPDCGAKPGCDNCLIEVSMTSEKDTYRMKIADNGIGLPEDFDFDNAKTMGMLLVRMLGRHQLGGCCEINGKNGTQMTLTFKAINGENSHD